MGSTVIGWGFEIRGHKGVNNFTTGQQFIIKGVEVGVRKTLE